MLIGIETSDDAGVYLLTEDIALIQTLDFFTPIVDEPYVYGQIAAANALSDVYAMGGKPILALNIACFPSEGLEMEVQVEILRGGADKVREAGALIVGGHTVKDKEPKYGLSVTGLVHPSKIISNKGAKPRDQLVLTKPLGSGIITTALKECILKEKDAHEIISQMVALNKEASTCMQIVGVNACTDITGFGLVGHALAMARASRVELRIKAQSVPVLPLALSLAEKNVLPGGARSNEKYVSASVSWSEGLSNSLKNTFVDPQTSGGLLISVLKDKTPGLLELLHNRGINYSRVIGEVLEECPGHISIE